MFAAAHHGRDDDDPLGRVTFNLIQRLIEAGAQNS
jgi:hypothetical protein